MYFVNHSLTFIIAINNNRK